VKNRLTNDQWTQVACLIETFANSDVFSLSITANKPMKFFRNPETVSFQEMIPVSTATAKDRQ
jgi:hypothetical protein